MPLTRSMKNEQTGKEMNEARDDEVRAPRVFRTPPASPSASRSMPPASVQVTDDLGFASGSAQATATPQREAPGTLPASQTAVMDAPSLAAPTPAAPTVSDATTRYAVAPGYAATGYDANTRSIVPPAPIVGQANARTGALPALSDRDAPFRREELPPPRCDRADSVRSVRTTASTAARRRMAEFEAGKRLAELKRQEFEMEAALIRQKLALDVALMEEEATGPASLPGTGRGINDHDQRVEAWLDQSGNQLRDAAAPVVEARWKDSRIPEFQGRTNDTACATAPGNAPGRRLRVRSPSPLPREDRRRRSPTPARSRERGVERLADALESMIRRRPPPRQAQELPLFHGEAVEWMPFQAAMKDSTEMFQFSAAENLARLRSCLRGEARNAVAAFLYTATDPNLIMKTLEQRFGRPEVIVDKTLDEIRRLPRVGATAEELNDFAVELQNTVCVLSNIDHKGYLFNPMLTREVLKKLSPHLKARWCDYADEQEASRSKQRNMEPEVAILSRFLMGEADKALRYAYSYTATAKMVKEVPERNKVQLKKVDGLGRKGGAVFTATAKEPERCPYCDKDHEIEKCKKFIAMNEDERWSWVKGQKICFNCLRKGHRRYFCKAKRCGIKECSLRHHALLHCDRPLPEKNASEEPAEEKPEKVMSASVSTAMQNKGQVLLKVCPVTVTEPRGLKVETYALLDEGATISLVDEDLARALHAEGPTRPLHIHAITTSQREMSQRVRLNIRGRSSDEEHEIQAFTMKDLNTGTQTVDRDCLTYQHLQELQDIDVCYEKARPRILIGADNWHLIVTRKLLTGKRHEPVASLTLLGWTLHGTLPRGRADKEGRVLHLRTNRLSEKDVREFGTEDEKLEDLLKVHYEVDSLGISLVVRPKKEDERAVRCFRETVRHTDGRYEVGLPWIEDRFKMPPSYEMAKRRLNSIEQKMKKSESFKTAYTAQIKNLLDKGYAELAKEDQKNSDVHWYLPHFGVTNPHKPGKLRLVFDAAARTNGVSLNDYLLDGPDLLRSLPGMLYRFREEQIAVTADIREMFLQVKIRKKDQPAQMFLWRENTEEEVREYVMTSMIFGARSSPFLAHSVRDHNAKVHGLEYPRALKAIQENHYMDDYVDSFPTKAEARATVNEVRHVHLQAGFVITSWNSNSKEALQDIPEQLHARTPKAIGKAAQNGRTLGLIWAADTDQLIFNTTLPRVPNEVKIFARPPTKREALSAVMSIFDPLGLLSYLTITAKILLQNLWRQKQIGWDDELPEDAAEEFAAWMRAVDDVASLRLPRWYSCTGGVRERQLHIFNDASEQAYATAAYWRFKYEDNSISVILAAAKAKVAPIKTQSIPRLELQANLIGTRLADSITEGHRQKPDQTVFWTDSTTALHWIRDDKVRYTPYVAHRLGEIAERTEKAQWRWIPTAENVADEATRISFKNKQSNERWFTGPAFLYEEEESWPTEVKGTSGMDMVMNVKEKEEQTDWLPDLARFSSYERLIRTTARVLAFTDICRRRTSKMELRHIQQAERHWMMKTQKDTYPEEISRLEKGLPISPSSKIAKLDPVLEDGVLRLRGRIDAANISNDTKRPCILDGRHPFTQLLVQDHHRKALHANRERVVNDLRQRFWTTRLRPTVRAIEKRCRLCQMRRQKPKIPVMGNLPIERLGAYVRPFSYCGVDYFGPILVTVGRRHEKRWCALFTCLTVRAVHLELVQSLTTDSAIMALRRMAARRGWPKTMYSDNGTNFRGADTEMKKAIEEWMPELQDYALQKRMEWKFITPGAPNQGGAWERLVRSVKVALTAILREKFPKEEVLLTLLAEAENCVNFRPLTHVSVDASDPEALTPNHFLLGGSAGLPTTGPCAAADRRIWRAAQGLSDEFWSRWVKEYLPTLLPRGESRGSHPDVKEGALVIVADENLPRNVWPRGVITRVLPGVDGIVRSAEVRTRGGILRRPVRKLVVLHLEE